MQNEVISRERVDFVTLTLLGGPNTLKGSREAVTIVSGEGGFCG